MSGKELIVLKKVLIMLKHEGINSKQQASKEIEKLVSDHEKKWGKK